MSIADTGLWRAPDSGCAGGLRVSALLNASFDPSSVPPRATTQRASTPPGRVRTDAAARAHGGRGELDLAAVALKDESNRLGLPRSRSSARRGLSTGATRRAETLTVVAASAGNRASGRERGRATRARARIFFQRARDRASPGDCRRGRRSSWSTGRTRTRSPALRRRVRARVLEIADVGTSGLHIGSSTAMRRSSTRRSDRARSTSCWCRSGLLAGRGSSSLRCPARPERDRGRARDGGVSDRVARGGSTRRDRPPGSSMAGSTARRFRPPRGRRCGAASGAP